jgi:hypothetical protein
MDTINNAFSSLWIFTAWQQRQSSRIHTKNFCEKKEAKFARFQGLKKKLLKKKITLRQ